jgi:hypothetical protein
MVAAGREPTADLDPNTTSSPISSKSYSTMSRPDPALQRQISGIGPLLLTSVIGFRRPAIYIV